jgi:hypothetical protein
VFEVTERGVTLLLECVSLYLLSEMTPFKPVRLVLTYGYHRSSFFWTCPHFQGLNYRPGRIYKIKVNVQKLGAFSFYSSSLLLNNEMK